MKNTRKKSRKIDRPFDPAVLRKAKRFVAQYRFVIEPDPELGYIGHVVEMPGVMGDGRTPADCLKMLLFGAETVVASMLEDGQSPPKPVSAARRREQVNIRLTPEEKAMLSSESEHKGYKGLSDFIRNAALRECVGH